MKLRARAYALCILTTICILAAIASVIAATGCEQTRTITQLDTVIKTDTVTKVVVAIDTLLLTKFDTVFSFRVDTVIRTRVDTVIKTVAVVSPPVHDTVIVNKPGAPDTTFITLPRQHDTTFVHDTAFVPVHDTTIVFVHDTTLVTRVDTVFVPAAAVHDTTWIYLQSDPTDPFGSNVGDGRAPVVYLTVYDGFSIVFWHGLFVGVVRNDNGVYYAFAYRPPSPEMLQNNSVGYPDIITAITSLVPPQLKALGIERRKFRVRFRA